MVRSEPENNGDITPWWVLPLGDAMQASPVLQTVCEAFAAARQQTGEVPDISLWLRTENNGLHCQQTLYFSAGCEHLAQQFGAVRCVKPSLCGLTRLAVTSPLVP